LVTSTQPNEGKTTIAASLSIPTSLAGLVDAVLLVVAAGDAERDEVQRAKDQLASSGTRVIGAVLDKLDPRLHGRPNQPYSEQYLEFPS